MKRQTALPQVSHWGSVRNEVKLLRTISTVWPMDWAMRCACGSVLISRRIVTHSDGGEGGGRLRAAVISPWKLSEKRILTGGQMVGLPVCLSD